jgi:hypothetical protein
VFLPFLHRLVAHAAGYAERPAWRQVGRRAGATRARRGALGRPRAARRAGTSRRQRALRDARLRGLLRAASLGQQRRGSGPDDRGQRGSGGVGPPGGGSRRGEGRPDSFGELARTAGAPCAESNAPRREGWWCLLFAALALLATESALSNRLSEAVR